MRDRVAAVIGLMLCVGCSAVGASPSAVAPAASTAQTSPTADPPPSAVPTAAPAPTPDLVELGRQYLALLEPVNRHVCSFDEGMNADLARYTEFVRIIAENERAFTDALRAMEFPLEMQAHVDARIEAGAAYHSVMTLIAAATTFAEANALGPRSEEANFAARDASNLIRGDLGLPGSPTCEEVLAGD